ncbi:MAG: hypothetical protein E7641_07015 [Ruminococcaceae bacterium]|nr:hypothetical protein [Oscillospiraceae bacterium]
MNDKLYLGVGRSVITPRVGANLYGYSPDVVSSSVHDDLTATAFYFRQGDVEALMISTTVCSIENKLSDRVLGLLERELGISRDRIILHATHTHSGPITNGSTVGWGELDLEYCENIFIPGIITAAKEAYAKPCAVAMGIAVGESLVGINRRSIRKDNKVQLGQNPWGAFDPKMTVISFKDEEGRSVANIIHYGCHGTASGKNTQISRDWSGVMTDLVEELSGGVTAFFNGPEGDVGPRMPDGVSTVGLRDVRFAVQMGGVAAQDAARIYRGIKGYRTATLEVSRINIEIALNKRIDLEVAEREYEKFKDETINLKAAQGNHYRDVIESYKNGYVDKKTKTIGQTVIRIGDVAFVSFPYELFSEIGMRIAMDSNIPHTLSLSNSNGSEGYFVTEDQICRGGYEVEMFKNGQLQPYADNADHYAVVGTLEHLKKLNCKGE